jgi:hypothetical protein
MAHHRNRDPADAIVVGLGATGGTAITVLTEVDTHVVGFDRGPWQRAYEHCSGDEPKFINRNHLRPDPMLFPRTLRRDEQSAAAAEGSRFPKLTGKFADAWRARTADMQQAYRDGIAGLDEIAGQEFGKRFTLLTESEQDRVLEVPSGAPKPRPVTLGTTEAVNTFLQDRFDEGLPFFGFPGPESLKDTMDGKYGTARYVVPEYDWKELVPHLRGRDAG